jgi:branched-chain amino acid transport system substrate-binding protein
MEPLTKRILAIVLIVAIGSVVGVTIFLVVAPYRWTAADCPGAPTNITEDQIIRVGVLGGLTDIQGAGALEGAKLAAYEINDAGGVTVGGKTYYIGITAEDTDESNPNLDVTKGVAAAERIISYKRAQFLTGGFRSESLLAYQEVIMDAKIPFINTGSATDIFCQNVLDNYDRYKYFFRNMPINSSSLGAEIIQFLVYTVAFLNATNPSININSFSILYEDLTWTTPLVDGLKAALPYYVPGLTLATEIAYPITVTQTQMDGYISQLDGNATQILIPVISAQGGILMMNSYATAEPGFVVVGVDVQAQLDTFWDDSNGNCAYETTLQALHNTSKTEMSVPFWNAFVAKYNHEPLYTAVGSYDAIYAYAWAINGSQSFNADTIVSTLETITTAAPLEGAGGMAAFTVSHDIQEGYPYGYTLFVQWHPDGTKAVVKSGGLPLGVYPDSLVTGAYLTPSGLPGEPWDGWTFNA